MKNIEIFNLDSLKELLDYSEQRSYEMKVQRVYHKCLRSGRIELARRIEHKHARAFPKSDRVIAMFMALAAEKNQPK